MKELLSTEQREEYLHIRQSWREDLAATDCFARAPSKHMGLTPRQKQALDFIKAFIDEHEYSPTYEEIGAGLGIQSKGAVHGLIQRLERSGRVTITPATVRSIAVVPDRLGRVA